MGMKIAAAWCPGDYLLAHMVATMGVYYDVSRWRTGVVCHNVTYKRRRTLVP